MTLEEGAAHLWEGKPWLLMSSAASGRQEEAGEKGGPS